jgi:hypothetical protein
MTDLPARIATLAALSLREPRAAARALLSEDVPQAARTGGLLLMAVLSALLLQPSFLLMPPTDDPVAIFLAQSPLQTAAVQWLVLMLSAVLIYRVGRAFEGAGSLPDALLVVVWLQLVMLGVQVLQLVALVLVPPLAALVGVGGFFLFVWLMVSFIAELHGFRSLGRVFLGVAVTFIAIVFIAAAVFALLLGPEVLENV